MFLEVLQIGNATAFQDDPSVESRILCIRHTMKECQSKSDETLHNTAKVLVVVIILIKYFLPKSGMSKCWKRQNDT